MKERKTEVQYLRERVEQLQKENIRLRIKIDRLEREKQSSPAITPMMYETELEPNSPYGYEFTCISNK